MNATEISTVALAIFIRMFVCSVASAEVKEYPTASSILEEAEREVDKEDKTLSGRRLWAYLSMVETCAKIGRTEDGNRLLDKAEGELRASQKRWKAEGQPSAKSDSIDLLALARAAHKLGNKDAAIAYLDEALQITEKLHPYVRAARQSSAALIYLDMGMENKCRRLVDTSAAAMQDVNDGDATDKGLAMSHIAEAYHRLGNASLAQTQVTHMVTVSLRLPQEGFDAYERFLMDMMILDASIAIEDYEGALRMARELELPDKFLDLADIYFEKGQTDKAEALLKEATDLVMKNVDLFGGKRTLAHTRGRIAAIYAKYDQDSKARECLAEVKKIEQESSESTTFGSPYRRSAWQVQAYTGDYFGAIETGRLLEQPSHRCEALTAILRIMTERH